MRLTIVLRTTAVSLAIALVSTWAAAENILLRTPPDCGALTPPACFSDLAAVLAELHQRPGNGRIPPGPTHPVVVDIGAGTFELTSTTYPTCEGLSNLSFRGAGKNVTILTGGGYPSENAYLGEVAFAPYVLLIRDCSQLDFSDLTVQTKSGVSRSGVRFVGSGNTWWWSVRMRIGDGTEFVPIIWLDSGYAYDESDSTHHWTDVQATIKGEEASGFWITGSHHEFRASHIKVETDADRVNGSIYGAIFGNGEFDLNVEGSLLEMVDTGTKVGALAAIFFSDATGFYPHCDGARASVNGSQLRVSSTANSGSVIGIYNICSFFSGGRVAARGTDILLEGASVTRKRIGGLQAIDWPYDHGAGANPPSVSAAYSRKGFDHFVETDCGALCGNTPLGAESHELLFDPACVTAGPWWDSATSACRGL